MWVCGVYINSQLHNFLPILNRFMRFLLAFVPSRFLSLFHLLLTE